MAAAFFAATESGSDEYIPYEAPLSKKPAPSGNPSEWEQWPKPKTKLSKVRKSKSIDPHTHGQGATLEYVGPSNPGEQKHAPTGAPRTEADEYAHVPSFQQQRRDEEKMMMKRAKRAMIEAERQEKEVCVRKARDIVRQDGERRVREVKGSERRSRESQRSRERRCGACSLM